MLISVRLFALARERVGRPEIELELTDRATVADVRNALASAYPAIADLLPLIRIAVDGDYVTEDALISANSEIAVIPPVSGGAFP